VATLFEIVTPRLRLYALTLLEIQALMRGERTALEARLGAAIPPEWPSQHLLEALPIIMREMGWEPGDARWVWVVVEPLRAALIGDIGYHGPLHDEATVEIGYTLLPEAQGLGYATEATAALIEWTFAHTKVAQIIAQIDPTNAASLRVAAKLGMRVLPAISLEHLCFGIDRPL
jgi:[ribosomal protein S5]-alanine N-acetyltransferase